MEIDERGTPDARAAERGSGSAEIAALRATCRRQARVIKTLTRVVGNLRSGVGALKAENAELRAERCRLDYPGFRPRSVAALEPGGERDETTLSRADPAGNDESHGREPGRAAVAGRPREVHVVPQQLAATWGVYVDAVAGALSEHTSETAAESAARAYALMRGAARIVVHDRYHRTRAGVLTSAE
jgi:hypothetical protein